MSMNEMVLYFLVSLGSLVIGMAIADNINQRFK